MKLEIHPLSHKKASESRLIALYLASFPPQERRPADKMLQLADDPESPLGVNVIETDGQFAGLINLWEFPDFIYIEHFATLHNLRGLGLGTATLDAIKSRYTKPILLEIEMPESSAMAARRLEFYRRNGFRPIWDFKYIQPPYSPELPSMPLLLMSTGDIDPRQASSTLHKEVYGVREDT